MLPTYQEADNIAEVLRRLRAAVPHADVLVVDDGSPDGTADLAKAVAHELGAIDVLLRPAKAKPAASSTTTRKRSARGSFSGNPEAGRASRTRNAVASRRRRWARA